MGFLKKLFLFLFIFVVIPLIGSVALLKYTATPIFNWILSQKINAPAYIEKVDVNWLLTEIVLKDLRIENPKGFPKGDMLKLREAVLNIEPQTYLIFKPYAKLIWKKLYFHFIRNSNNSTNIATALGLPQEKAKVSPLEFEIKDTNGVIELKTLKDIEYLANGRFVGFGNNAVFEVKGKADLSTKENPKTIADFTIYNWKLENNRYLNLLAGILANPELRSVTLTKIEGRIEIDEPWLIFKDRNTKAYILNDKLFAEIYEGSKYNRLTKDLDIKLALYLPNKVEFEIYGNAERPKVKLLNPSQLQNVINNNRSVKKFIEEPTKEIKEKLEETLKGLFH